jgi:hypothetical protein
MDPFEAIRPPFLSLRGAPLAPSRELLRRTRMLARRLRQGLLELLQTGRPTSLPEGKLHPEVEECLLGLLGIGHTRVCVPTKPILFAAATQFPGVWLVARQSDPQSHWEQWIEIDRTPSFLLPYCEIHPSQDWKSNLPEDRPCWLLNLLEILSQKVELFARSSTPSKLDFSPWILSSNDLAWLEGVIGKGPVVSETDVAWDQILSWSSRWPRLWWTVRSGRSGTIQEHGFEIACCPTHLTPSPWRIAQAAEELEKWTKR